MASSCVQSYESLVSVGDGQFAERLFTFKEDFGL
jgi:hypothetical protein